LKNNRIGEGIVYYSNGKIKEQGKYQGLVPPVQNPKWIMVSGLRHVVDLKEGNWIGYHENGQISYEGSYLQGAKIGIWKFYDEKGALIEESPTFFGHLVKDVWDRPYGLNAIAWKCYEEINDEHLLREAERAILRAIELDEKYSYIDTYAHVLFKMGKYQDAFHWAIRALEFAKKEKVRSFYTTKLLRKLEGKL